MITYTTLWLIQVYLELMVMHPPGVLIVGEALVWAQVMHRDRPHGKVPRSSSEAVMLFRWLLTKESRDCRREPGSRTQRSWREN